MPPGGIEGWSLDWRRRHLTHHLTVFPNVDQRTRDNLAELASTAEAAPSDSELPGMWERADFEGGLEEIRP